MIHRFQMPVRTEACRKAKHFIIFVDSTRKKTMLQNATSRSSSSAGTDILSRVLTGSTKAIVGRPVVKKTHISVLYSTSHEADSTRHNSTKTKTMVNCYEIPYHDRAPYPKIARSSRVFTVKMARGIRCDPPRDGVSKFEIEI